VDSSCTVLKTSSSLTCFTVTHQLVLCAKQLKPPARYQLYDIRTCLQAVELSTQSISLLLLMDDAEAIDVKNVFFKFFFLSSF